MAQFERGRVIRTQVGEGTAQQAYPTAIATLTRRELEVLAYLSDGRRTQAEIATALDVGMETVRSHTASIRRKLGVRRNRELIGVLWAENGTHDDHLYASLKKS